MKSTVCPHLGTLDTHNRRDAPATFPSFENQCLASGSAKLIMLGDQATHCLSAGYTSCPRFRAAAGHPVRGTDEYIPFYQSAEEAWDDQSRAAATAGTGSLDDFMLGSDRPSPSRRWAWGGAGLIFASVLLCGAFMATYTGWEWVSRRLPEGVTAPATAAAPAVFVVLTATPQDGVSLPVGSSGDVAGGPVVVAPPDTGSLRQFPEAVTPTPITILPAAGQPGAPGEALPPGAGVDSGSATPLVDVALLVPTRRPTPEFDLPTSTPLPLPPTETPSSTPAPLGTPVIIFAPANKELPQGECTLVRWNVMNVREVYYENLPMSGKGERRECMDDHNEIYTLLVILGDGQSQIYTTTVAYLPPTPTTTPTPSFTPEPVFTPTWTPAATTPTPPPNVGYGAGLAVNGSADVTCAAGQSCEIGLIVTNTGDGSDNISVLVTGTGAFPVQLCRPDGVCSDDSLPISDIGSGNTAFVTARVRVPADAASGAATSYSFQSFSEGSGRGISSAPVTVNIRLP